MQFIMEIVEHPGRELACAGVLLPQRDGHIRSHAGNSIDYSDATQWFMDMVREYELFPAWIYYDSYSTRYFVEERHMQEFNMVQCIQGAKMLSLPVKNQSPKQCIDGTAVLLDCYVGLYE